MWYNPPSQNLPLAALLTDRYPGGKGRAGRWQVAEGGAPQTPTAAQGSHQGLVFP